MEENNNASQDKHECNFTKQFLIYFFFGKESSITEKWILKQNIVVLHSTTLVRSIARNVYNIYQIALYIAILISVI